MVHLAWLFMKTHLLSLLQDNCLDLVRSAFLRKLSACVRNITAFSQHQLRPIKSAVLADADISIKPKYRSIYRPWPKYRSISNATHNLITSSWDTQHPWFPDQTILYFHASIVNHFRNKIVCAQRNIHIIHFLCTVPPKRGCFLCA